MKKKDQVLMLIFVVGLSFWYSCSTNSIQLDKKHIRLVNRQYLKNNNLNSDVIMLDSKKGDGLAILENMTFTEGIIELDLLGENAPGKSFVGLAFNIQNDSTYEAIYFRPFNFQSDEKTRREHSIQYIFHPNFYWRKLRTEREGEFEAEFFDPPNPEEWFSIQIKVSPKKVIVMDKKNGNELMEVNRLTSSKSNKIGFWTGHNSKGSFKNLSIE